MYNPFLPKTRLSDTVTYNITTETRGGGRGAETVYVYNGVAYASRSAAQKAMNAGATPAKNTGGGGNGQSAAAKKAAEKAAAKKAAEKAAAKKAAERAAAANAAANAKRKAEQKAAEEARLKMSKAQQKMAQASMEDPGSLTAKADVVKINQNAPGTTVGRNVGQLRGDAPQIAEPEAFDAVTVDPTKVADDVAAVTDDVEAVQGEVSEEAQVTAVTADPTELAALDLEAEQLSESQVVTPAAARTLESGELISGSAVDMAAVEEALDIEAAQANPSAQATVRGQMAELMQDFEVGDPPAWAAGALRNATAAMAARGLGASSMAGQALIQAAMESAAPLAMADAQTFAKFESQNLSNRQQTAMFAAEQRANFLSMEFTQEFQTRVANAAKVSDIANINFTAETQIALENARMAQTVDLANLNAKNAKMMSDAAAMSQMDLANLNNRQQAAVVNAQSFLQMDLKNMDLEQQTELFKAQSNIQAIFSDQAADNAAKQFNASSENQTNQFFATMSQQVQQFNAGMEVQRDQFNAQNALIVAQANAQWRQNATTIDTAAQNQANADAAMQTNQMTQNMVDTLWQRERDIMDYAFRQSENESDRALSVFLADKQVELAEWQTLQGNKQADKEGKGYLVSRLLFG